LCAFADGTNRCFVGTLEDDIEEVGEEEPRSSRRDGDDDDEDEEDDEGQILLAIYSIASVGVWAVELSSQSGLIFVYLSFQLFSFFALLLCYWVEIAAVFFFSLFETIMIFFSEAVK